MRPTPTIVKISTPMDGIFCADPKHLQGAHPPRYFEHVLNPSTNLHELHTTRLNSHSRLRTPKVLQPGTAMESVRPKGKGFSPTELGSPAKAQSVHGAASENELEHVGHFIRGDAISGSRQAAASTKQPPTDHFDSGNKRRSRPRHRRIRPRGRNHDKSSGPVTKDDCIKVPTLGDVFSDEILRTHRHPRIRERAGSVSAIISGSVCEDGRFRVLHSDDEDFDQVLERHKAKRRPRSISADTSGDPWFATELLRLWGEYRSGRKGAVSEGSSSQDTPSCSIAPSTVSPSIVSQPPSQTRAPRIGSLGAASHDKGLGETLALKTKLEIQRVGREESSQMTKRRSRKKGICKCCESSGHWAKDCPNRTRDSHIALVETEDGCFIQAQPRSNTMATQSTRQESLQKRTYL